MKICIIFGTRPEIIKISPIIKECKKRKIDFFLIHTNQHYSKELDGIFFECLKLSKPKYNLNIGSWSHGEMTAKMLISIEKILIEERPTIVLVQGDTNSGLAGALSAVKLNISIGHIEAGLRSFDKTMPEEINRILVDHISDYLFVPTSDAQNNLLREGIPRKKIFCTGNTIVDAISSHIKIANSKSKILKSIDLISKKYILSTIHRQENVDNYNKLKNIMDGIQMTSEVLGLPVIISAHPRLIKMLKYYQISLDPKIRLINPVDYLDFITLEKNAKIIITDSGGVQEEACIMNIPCVTVRENTERPETLQVGSNVLVGSNIREILSKSIKMNKKIPNWSNPFGNGDSSKKIINMISKII